MIETVNLVNLLLVIVFGLIPMLFVVYKYNKGIEEIENRYKDNCKRINKQRG